MATKEIRSEKYEGKSEKKEKKEKMSEKKKFPHKTDSQDGD